MLTKTNYLCYLEAPLHLWADQNGWLDQDAPSSLSEHLMEQGKTVELLGREFLQSLLQASPNPPELTFEQRMLDGNFHARLDALAFDPVAQVYDLYEIKSASSIKKEHLIDATFQRLVTEANHPVRHSFLVHLNKAYTRRGPLETDQLFQVVNVDEDIENLRQEVLSGREAAWQVAVQEKPDGLDACLKPKECPCPMLCHPELPEYSIFDIPRLGQTKARLLKSQGLLNIYDLPEDFPLSDTQREHVQVIQSGWPKIDHERIKTALDQLTYPLYFLDYETFNPAVPEYDGYHPFLAIVFQYSLHIYTSPDADPVHHEYLATGEGDPSRRMLEHLLPNIGAQGSVIVWNKSFEASRNKEMAARYPEYAGQLEQINERIFDLMEIFSKGAYIHPDFHGSASIKNVFPVLVKDLSYDNLAIPKGDQAMTAWVSLMRGSLSAQEAEKTRQELLQYCALDTLAMVKNWQAIRKLVSS